MPQLKAPSSRPIRRIILCADDYGLAPGVDAAIRDLFVRGRLSATSVMVVTPTFNRGEALALNMLNMGARHTAIGLHVTLTAPHRPLTAGFRPHQSGAFPTLGRLMARGLARRLDPAALASEIRAQITAFTTTFGRPPDFVDGHQHVQLLPRVSEALLDAVKELAPGAWVRQCGRTVPRGSRFADPKGLILDLLSRRFCRLAGQRGIAVNPAFAGTYDFGGATPFDALFPRFLAHLPDGGLIMCHPGTVDAELTRLDPLTTRRQDEYAYFGSDAFAALLTREGVMLA
jgi:chitin disaccharide deacetylase